MPHSLRVKIKCLRYKGIITDKDCDRLCKALDNEDVLDKIRAEISEQSRMHMDGDLYIKTSECMQIIDRYKVNKHEPKPNIKALGEDMRICQKSITDEKVLIGFNMAVAICNKHLAESEVEK